MVEMAMVLPLLVLLFVGVTEFGFAFKDKLLVSNAVQTATRTGASLGQNETADMAILDSIQQGFSGLPGSGKPRSPRSPCTKRRLTAPPRHPA